MLDIENIVPTGESKDSRGEVRRLAARDLIALSGALLLETSVVGVALTDTGKVEA